MKNQEINRDIKLLWNKFKNRDHKANTEAEIKKEWIRLWNADSEARYMKVEQLKAMLRINGSLRFRPLHTMNLFFEPQL